MSFPQHGHKFSVFCAEAHVFYAVSQTGSIQFMNKISNIKSKCNLGWFLSINAKNSVVPDF